MKRNARTSRLAGRPRPQRITAAHVAMMLAAAALMLLLVPLAWMQSRAQPRP